MIGILTMMGLVMADIINEVGGQNEKIYVRFKC